MDYRMGCLLGVSLYLGGCAGEAELLRRDAFGGELSLRGPMAGAVARARELMVESCAGRYQLQEVDARLAPANALSGTGHIRFACATRDPWVGELAEHSALDAERATMRITSAAEDVQRSDKARMDLK